MVPTLVSDFIEKSKTKTVTFAHKCNVLVEWVISINKKVKQTTSRYLVTRYYTMFIPCLLVDTTLKRLV